MDDYVSVEFYNNDNLARVNYDIFKFNKIPGKFKLTKK